MSPHDIPDTHFVDSAGRPHPLVVRHATGEPEYAIVDGALVPFAQYKPPKAAKPQGALAIQAEGAGVSFGLSVT